MDKYPQLSMSSPGAPRPPQRGSVEGGGSRHAPSRACLNTGDTACSAWRIGSGRNLFIAPPRPRTPAVSSTIDHVFVIDDDVLAVHAGDAAAPAMLREVGEETTASSPPIAEHREAMVNNGEFTAIEALRAVAYLYKPFVYSKL